MRYFIYILLYLKILVISADDVASTDKFLSCEYSDTDWQALDIDQLYTCDILTDAIDSPNYKIKFEDSETEKVEGLRFLDNKNVKFLPNNIGEIFPNLKALAVSGTYLNTLNSNDLKGLTKLRYATFANSDLNVIEDGTFKDLSALEELDFRDSNIRIIEEDAFHGMTSLKTLYLSGNKLNSLEPKTFDGLESLHTLSLELNHLEYIDENLFETNGNLEDIWLNKNKIIGISYKVFEKIPKLAYVDLRENICIDYVYDPDNFDELKDDCDGKCTAVPPPREVHKKPDKVDEIIEEIVENKPNETFRYEYKIDGDIDTGLYSQSIKIIESPDEIDETVITNDVSSKIVECQSIQIHWKLSNSELPTCVIENQIIDSKDFNIALSSSVDDGNAIKAMSFAQNKYIKFLPQNIGMYAPNLEEFSARNASLRIISKNNFAGLKHLKSLNLADNKIKFIDPDAFDDLTSLEELDLSGNELSTLDSEIFRKLKNLKILRIGSNQIHSLPSNLFQNLRNLVNISISHQHISDINANTFKANTKLKNVWMNSNKLKSLSPNMFTSKLKDLEYVDMRDNKCIDGFYDQSHFQQMKTEIQEKCGKKYIVPMNTTKLEDQKKKGKKPKKDSKKNKNPKLETDGESNLDEKEVICDYEDIFWPHLNKTLKTCVINEAIDNPNFFISANPLFGDYVNADTIEAISFKNNKNVKYLPKNLFDIFPNLVEFSAENAGLTKINPQDFKGLKKLKSLNLSGNGLKSIDRDSFKDLTSLEELILDDNDIEEFEEETFTYTKKLKKLRMKGNKLRTVHETWFEDMPDLEEVSFTFSDPVVLQKQIFHNNPNLKDIDWNGKHYDGKLNEIDEDAVVDTTEENERRKEISCKYEEVSIPESGETMTVCNIYENDVIDDSDYFIKSSPQNNQVKKFVIYNNQNIKFLPRNLGKTFPMLEEIDVDNTALDVIDRESFQNLPLLKTLKMSRNKIQNFESDTFDDLPQLEEFDMSENELELIKDGAFYKMKNLKNLNLGKNKLNSIDPKTFKVMKNLRKISLSGNNIQFLDRHTFKNNPDIEEIDLSENDIESLNPKTFEKLRKLKRVLFKGNKCLDEEFNSSQLSDLKSDISKNCKMPKKSTKEVSCELKDVEEGTSDVVDITTCVVDEDIEIDEPGYKFTIDTSTIDPSHIRTLSISNNPRIKYLPENIGQLFPNLENVMITNTSIEDVPDEIFNDMDKVKFVDLSRNKIKRLNPNSFNGLSSINKINLGDNEFEEFDHVPFTKIPSISAIDIRGNRLKPGTRNLLIKYLPDIDFEGIDEIEDPVTEIIEEVTEIIEKEVTCDNIEQNHSKGTFKCTISSQVIDSPDYVLKLPENLNVNSFTLVGNDDVQYIPKNLQTIFPNVKHLKFHKTGIKEVPQVIKNFNNLESLDLSNNKIKTLKSSDFYNLPSLKKLSLDGNLIEDVDESTFDLPSLEWINLSGNKISSIRPKTFYKLRKLKWISLEDNDDALNVDENLFEPIPSKNIEISYTKGGKKKIIEVNADNDEDEEFDSSEDEYEEETEIQIIRRKTTKKTRKQRPHGGDEDVEEQYTETTEYFFTNEVTCDWETDDDMQTCIINGQPIRSKGYKIKSTPNDSKVNGFRIENNGDVEFLPENIGDIFPNLQKLTVRNTSVSEIPGEIFRKMHKLKTLELPNNNLSELDPEMLSDAPILEEVNLSGNKIKKLPEDIFKFVPDLKVVELDNNEITELDPKIFESVPNLSKLSIEGNNIPMELSEDMFTNNPFLKISRSTTTTIKSSLVDDDSKELECDVGWKRVESGSDSSVSNSDDENNEETLTCILEYQSIPDEYYKIKSTSKNPEIKALSIEDSPDVKFLPENIGELFPNLETISIKNTSISKVPHKVLKKLKKLKILNLPNNNLSELDPEMLDDMPMLEEIDFSGNSIEKLPKTLFKKVPKLKVINFENNEFTELEPEIFESLPHLTTITMDGDDLPDEFTQKLINKHPRLKIIKSTIKLTTVKSIIEIEDPDEVECDTEYVEWESIDEDNDDVSNILTCFIRDQEIKKKGFKIKPTSKDQQIHGVKIENNEDVKFLPDNIGDLFPNIQKISVQNTSVSEIPKEVLQNLDNLNLLELSNNKIKELDPEIFKNLPQLEEIDLSGNEIQEIPDDLFNNLPELKVVALGENEITHLDPELFKNNPKLTKLTLDGIPDEVTEELISKIPILKIPTSKITIESTTTTESVTDNPGPNEVTCETEYSEWISIDNNDVSQVLTCIIQDQKIVDPGSKIKSTPYDNHIHGIRIENNKDVKFVPENIGQLFPNLQKISIQNTSVSKIPNEVLENLDNLKVLDLSNNDIKELEPEIFNNIPMLEEIDLSENKIKELPDDLFKNVPELKVVDLANNEIIKLDPEIFESTPHLKKLVVDGNDLPSDLNEDSFVYNPMLEISKESKPQKSTVKPIPAEETTEGLLEEAITVAPIKPTTETVSEKSTQGPTRTTVKSAQKTTQATTTKRIPVSRTTSRYTTKSPSRHTTSRPSDGGSGIRQTTLRTTTTQRPRPKPEISSTRATTTTPRAPLKTVKCGIIYETSESDSKNVIKCDMTDQNIEDPEVSFAEIPNGKEVEVLNFDNNKNIKYLPDNIAKVFPNLKEITAKNSAIDLILPGDFEDLNKLENVVLSGNDLKSIEPETFDGLDNLKNLDLSNNQIEFIDEDAFGRLPSLKNLNLDNNEITFIHPKTFRNIPKLETLKIEGNSIPSLHENIFRMNPKLKEVRHSIPSFVLSTTTTQKPRVNIHTSFIKSSTTMKPKILPTTTTQKTIDTRTTTRSRYGVSPFKEVDCDYANIQWDFSDDVLFSCDLKDAVIDDTNYVIKQSPKNKRVKGLSLVDSKNIKFLPQNIDKAFPNLVEISTFNSSIKHVPKESLKNLPKLRGLNLMSSGISTIAPNAFDEIPSVEFIELSDNNIKDLHPDIFKKVPALKYLYLNDNNIKSLDPSIFENLPELRNISLEGNEIGEVSRKLFKNNDELQNVWLNGNRISAIDPKIFDGKRALEYVDLRENDCINEFFEGYEVEGIRNVMRSKCKTPEEAPTEEVISTTAKPVREPTVTTQKVISVNPYPTRKPPHSLIDSQKTTTQPSYQIYTERPPELQTIPSYDHRTTTHKSPSSVTEAESSTIPSYNYRTTRRSPSSATERPSPTRGPQHFIGTTEIVTKRPKEVKCSLNYHEFPGTRPEIYTCFISEQSIDDPEFIIMSTPHDEFVTGVAIDDNKNVKFIPQNIGDIFPNLKHLSAKHNSIENVPSLNNLENVKTLDLSDNGLKIIDPEVLKKLPLLEELNLSGNQIPLFINGTFDNLPILKTLDISRNNIGELSPDIFNKLPELQKVSLDNNELTELPEKIFRRNPKLQVVNLNGNKINKINPETFENLPNLGEVNLEENPCINGVYKSGAFYAMKSDVIRGCAPDDYISPAVEEFVDKTTTTIRPIEILKPNGIECNYGDTYSSTSDGYLPTCMINEGKVVEDPEWKIKEMPANKRVKRFMIFDNDKIEKLPSNLGETFPDLNDIIVTGAPIKSISPKDFKDLNNLKSIAITGSSIKVLDPETFKGAPLLEDLDLSSNNIRHIDDGAFEGIKRLKNLDLSGNKIPKISQNVLKQLPELKTLKLTGNDLQNVDADLFKGNPKLYKVNLDENNLRSIDPDVFDRLPHLIDINLSKNDCIDRSFGASNMHAMRKIVNENCQPYDALKNELRTCKKEIEKCISRPRENDVREKETLKDTIKKSDIKIKQLNIQLNKLRNALNAEKAMLRKEVEKSKNLETELDGMRMKCARIDENHNMLIDLNCNYNELNNEQYSCNVRDLKVKIENSTIENPNGNHKRGKRDVDVNSLIISNQDVKYIPNGISNHFPQLKELTIENSGLVKINQGPLRHLPHLTKLIIRGNDIHHIEPTALNDNPQLEHLDLSQNNIMDIPIKLLEEMPKLKILNLNDNALLSLPQNIIPNVNSLKTFTVGNNNLNFIDPRIFKRLDSVGVVDFTNNKCIDKMFNENDDDRRDYMSFIGIVSIKCTNNVDDSGEDGFCTGRKN